MLNVSLREELTYVNRAVLVMPDERAELAKADQDIADGDRRISEQIIRITEMREKGYETARAEELLETLKATLEAWVRHRELILDAIDRERHQHQ